MQISWLGHSCFKISHDGYSLVIDPYDLYECKLSAHEHERRCRLVQP